MNINSIGAPKTCHFEQSEKSFFLNATANLTDYSPSITKPDILNLAPLHG